MCGLGVSVLGGGGLGWVGLGWMGIITIEISILIVVILNSDDDHHPWPAVNPQVKKTKIQLFKFFKKKIRTFFVIF